MNCPSYVFICLYAAAWIVGSCMFLYRGILNLVQSQSESNLNNANLSVPYPILNLTNSSDIVTDTVSYKGYRTGVVLIVVSSFMLTLVPVCAFVTLIEKRYRNSRTFRMVPQDDLPPKYEDVVARDEDLVPTYSSLAINQIK